MMDEQEALDEAAAPRYRSNELSTRAPSARARATPSHLAASIPGPHAAGSFGASELQLKARLRWSPELHARFETSVNALGGMDKATPKAVMLRMGVGGLTIQHIKSHLQKHRLQMHEAEEGPSEDKKNTLVAAPPRAAHVRPRSRRRSSGARRRETQSLVEDEDEDEEDPVTGAMRGQLQLQAELFQNLSAQRQLQAELESHAATLTQMIAAQAQAAERAAAATGQQQAMAMAASSSPGAGWVPWRAHSSTQA